MFGYIYLTLVAFTLIYSIIKDIYLFNKGQYNPYMYRNRKRELPFIVFMCLNLGVSIGAIYLLTIEMLTIMLYMFICYSLTLIVCRSILNYLSYLKIKESIIIFQGIVFNFMIIAISTSLWILVKR